MSGCEKKSANIVKFFFFVLIFIFLINFSLAANLNVTLFVPNSQVVHSQNMLVYGIVTNSTGSPISNANVTLFAPNCDWNYSLTGNYYGNLSFPGFNMIINNITVGQFNGSAGSGSIRISGCNIAVLGSIDAYGKGFGGGGGGGGAWSPSSDTGNSSVDGVIGNLDLSTGGGAGGGFGGGGGGVLWGGNAGRGSLGGGSGSLGSSYSGGGGGGSGNGICLATNGSIPAAGVGCSGGGNGGIGNTLGYCNEAGGGGGGGAGPFGGAGGDAGTKPGNNGARGGYDASGANSDTSTDFSLFIGSGGGGGAGSRILCNSGLLGGAGGMEGGNPGYAGSGGGGAAGGGMIVLNAYNNILINGILNSSGGGKSSLAGGYGAGGGILLIAKTINVSSGNIRTLGGDRAGGGVRTNGGTIKVFYNTSFFGSIPTANSARNYNSSTSSVNLSLQNFGIITTNSSGGFSFNLTAPNLKSFYNVSANVSSNIDSGISSVNIQVIGLPEVYFNSPTIVSGSTFSGTSFVVNVSARNNSYTNLTVNVYNIYGALVRSNFTSANQTFMNFTGFGGGLYYINATAYNLAGYSNTTETRSFTISTDLKLNFFGQIGTGGNISTSGNYTIHRFSYNGSDQTFVAGTPADVEIKMWGAGGGGGNAGGWSYGFAGGAGGYTAYNYSMIVGQSLIVMVGQGGAGGSIVSLYPTYGGGSRSCNVNSDCRYGGQGGGRSAIRNLTDDILTAGGGGGGGSSRASNGQRGGAGGGTIAQDGVSYNTAYRGRAGNQTAGGIIPSGGAGLTAGSKYAGGNPSNNGYGGGGGGGYYGGSGGGYAESYDMGGGGGGSGFVFGNGITLTGNYETAANSADPDRGNAGTGGAVNSRGSNGTVIFKYLTPVSRGLANNSLGRQNSIYADVYLASSNLKNVTYYLYNSSNLLNASTYTSVSANSINWTNLSDGVYYFNATAYDNSNSYVQTDTRVVTLDSTFPNATLISPSNATISSNSLINFTANVTDNLGIKNITLKILNIRNQTLISSVYGGGNLSAGTILVDAGVEVYLNDGLYSWYYDIFDYAGNNYLSESRNLTVDNPPNGTLSNPVNNSYVNGSPTFTADLIDLGTGIANATFYIYNSSGLYYSNSTPIIYSITSSSGGIINYSDDYVIHVFSSSDTFTVTGAGVAEVLVVAGGAGGGTNGNARGAGGGAGGLIYIDSFPLVTGTYSVTVGDGGSIGGNGQDSVLSGNGRTLRAEGGGKGANDDWTNNGATGGSGGGQWYPGYTGAASTQSSSTSDGISVYPNSGFGNKGGDSSSSQPYGSGGGGAGAAGGNWNDVSGPVGGIGKSFSISGFDTYYAGGGGSAAYPYQDGYIEASGGLGGGGAGNNNPGAHESYQDGSPNSGGGGGSGGLGGSGIVIIRYRNVSVADNTFTEGILTSTVGVTVNLIEGVYTWFVRVFDWSANLFETENRTLTVDTTLPIVNLTSPDKYYNTSIDSWNLTSTLSDNFGIKNATLRVYDNTGALYNSQVFKNGSGSGSLKSCSDILTSDPTSVDGLYSVCPDDTNCYQVYCDMTHGGWSSIFKMDSYLTLDSNDCVINYDNDDMDSTIMWQDLSTKISYTNNDDTDQAYWLSWQRDGTQDMNANYLPNRPGNIGSNARPVPLPLANTTIWFDWQNYQIAWIINGDTYTKTFSDAGISGSGYMDYSGYNYYFISDGVSMIHVGDYNWGAVLLKFDFVANNFSTESASVLSPPYSWYDTEEDAFGHVLYTVNGRVMYYIGGGNFRLGGTLSDPNNLADDYSVLYPLGYDTQHAIDFFARVDNSGYLWFGDWGHDDGGYFNCGNDNYFGVARSNILLTYQDIPPTAPVSAGGAFEEGLLNTNVSKQFTFDDGIYNWSYQTTDLAGNMVISENRTLTVDTTSPTISNIVYSPNLQPSVDPGQTLIFNATVSDALIGVDTVILQVNNSTASINYTMIYTSGNIYVSSINLSMVNNLTYTYNVWANDSLNNLYQSQNGNFISLWDCTWNYTTYKSPYTSFGSIAGYDINKNIGNITIFNTGDAAYWNYNCSLIFRLSNNLGANRIYFDGAPLNPSDSYILDAKNNATILVDASFSASTSVITESLNIVVDDVYDRSETNARNVTATLITSQAGPYLIQDDISYDSIIELIPGNFTLNAYLQNVMGDNLISNANNTAYNVSFEWIVPLEFNNITGNSSIYFENISDIDFHYNPITLGFDDLESMGDGVKTFYLISRGYNNLTGNLSLITDELGRNVLNDSFNITFTCMNVSGDGICVSGCRYSHIQDSDCAAVGTGGNDGKGGNTGGSGGGGGGSSTSGSKIEKSEASFELVRGSQNEFTFEVKNRYDYDLTGVNITVSGINAEYIKISPSSFASIKAKESKNITVKISAPAYFSGKKYTLIFDISGKMIDNSTGKKIDYTDKKAVTLSIVEIPRVQAEDLLINATNYLEEMNKSGMILKEASALFSSLNSSYDETEFGKVKQIYAQLKLLHDNAFEAKALIEELIASLADAKTNGIKTTEAKKLLLLGQTIYERGDYALALERLKEAKLTYALEVKGEFNLAYAIKNHPLESLGILIGLGLISLGSGLAIRFQLLRRKLRMLNEEEVLLLELMKVIQKECFEKNHMSMEEYEAAMFQYENRLSETVQEKITVETKIANILKIKGKRVALGEEKNRLISMVRKVQDDYLNKGKIETRIYENMIKSYTRRLSDVEEQIATMDADEAVRNSKKIVD